MLGSQCGLTPDQVLNMNVPMVQACIDGYQEHLFDMQCLAVHNGYWAGYYQSKKPKSANYILEKMIKEHCVQSKKNNPNLPKPEVDLDRFLKLEAKRMEYLAKHKRK